MRNPESKKQPGDFLGAKITDRDYYRRRSGTRPPLNGVVDAFYQEVVECLTRNGFRLPHPILARLAEVARKHKTNNPQATVGECINAAVAATLDGETSGETSHIKPGNGRETLLSAQGTADRQDARQTGKLQGI